MGKRIVVVGAGAVGGYTGGHMARNGADVTFIDPWPEHVESIRAHGIQLSGVTEQERFSVAVETLHLSDVQRLSREPSVDIAFICMKSYDTEWAAALIRPYLAPEGFVVSLQNCINEETVAGVVGWGKTVGCIASLIAVDLHAPGQVKRTIGIGGEMHTVFRVGEVHGRTTERTEEVAALLRSADSARVTTNLWGERWTKLVANVMRNCVSASTGMGGSTRDRDERARGLTFRLAGEAIRVGRVLGYDIANIAGMKPDDLVAAAAGSQKAQAACTEELMIQCERRTDEQIPSMGQDIRKGRRTEIDFINGLIVERGRQAGIETPVNAAMVALMKRVERGELSPSPSLIEGI